MLLARLDWVDVVEPEGRAKIGHVINFRSRPVHQHRSETAELRRHAAIRPDRAEIGSEGPIPTDPAIATMS